MENVDRTYFTYKGLQPGPIDASSSYLDERPKAVSDTRLSHVDEALLKGKKYPRPLSGIGTYNPHKSSHKHHNSNGTNQISRSRAAKDPEDSWLTHATTYTTSLLAEGKGQAFVASHSSMTNLQGYAKSSGGAVAAFTAYNTADGTDSDDNHAMTASNVTIKPSHKQKLRRSFIGSALHPSATAPAFSVAGDYDEPLRSPGLSVAAQQGWGSRFGSRSNSVVNSRRASRGALDRSGATTPFASGNPNRLSMTRPGTSHSNAGSSAVVDDYDDEPASQPAFVDPAAQAEIAASLAAVRAQRAAQEAGYFEQNPHARDPEDSDEDPDAAEEELVRLATTPGVGPFSFLDRIVGMSNFAFDGEDVGRKGADDSEDEEEEVTGVAAKKAVLDAEAEGNRRRRSVMTDLQAMFSRQAVQKEVKREGSAKDTPSPAQQEGGGWNDAAWLLSVASKLLL